MPYVRVAGQRSAFVPNQVFRELSTGVSVRGLQVDEQRPSAPRLVHFTIHVAGPIALLFAVDALHARGAIMLVIVHLLARAGRRRRRDINVYEFVAVAHPVKILQNSQRQ